MHLFLRSSSDGEWAGTFCIVCVTRCHTSVKPTRNWLFVAGDVYGMKNHKVVSREVLDVLRYRGTRPR